MQTLNAAGWANGAGTGFSSYEDTTDPGGSIYIDAGSGIFSKPTPTALSSTNVVQVQVTSCSAGVLQNNTFMENWN